MVDKRRSECLRQDIKKNNKTRRFIWRSVNYNNREKDPTFKHAKTERVQHHQTSFKTNAKGTSLGKKQKRRKTLTITSTKHLRK